MKKLFLIPVITILGLTACTQLSVEDRALITSAAQNAREAKERSMQATDIANAARDDAHRAAKAAQIASDRADRIFREGQNK